MGEPVRMEISQLDINYTFISSINWRAFFKTHLQACAKQIYDWTLINTNTVNKHTIYIYTYNIKLMQKAYAFIYARPHARTRTHARTHTHTHTLKAFYTVFTFILHNNIVWTYYVNRHKHEITCFANRL